MADDTIEMLKFVDGKPVLSKEAAVMAIVAKVTHYYVHLFDDAQPVLSTGITVDEIAHIAGKMFFHALDGTKGQFASLAPEDYQRALKSFVEGAVTAVETIKLAEANKPPTA